MTGQKLMNFLKKVKTLCSPTSCLMNFFLEKSACPEHQVVSGFSYGGQKVEGRKYPWIGVLQYQDQIICGSNLSSFSLSCCFKLHSNLLLISVSRKHALLAAHCIKGKKDHLPLGPEFYVIKFSNDASSDFSSDVFELILHPRWDSKSEHFEADIAIAVLKEAISFTPEVSKICFNTPNQPVENFVGQNATLAGWGYPDQNTTQAVLDLREVIVPIANQTDCAASDRLKTYNADTLFCAGSKDGKTGPCRGEYIKNFAVVLFTRDEKRLKRSHCIQWKWNEIFRPWFSHEGNFLQENVSNLICRKKFL